ncbi:hypothetical protein ACROYT_G016693 [Oculina patagonica]
MISGVDLQGRVKYTWKFFKQVSRKGLSSTSPQLNKDFFIFFLTTKRRKQQMSITMAQFACLLAAVVLLAFAVETHCQGSLSGPSGFRPCDDRYLLRDRNQQQQKKLSHPAHCCGSRSYNPNYQLCCRGRLLVKQPGKYCCGSLTYDPKSQLCCGGTVKTKTGSLNACCGSIPYDSSKQSCCYGQIVSKPPAGQPSGCCGRKSYNPSTQVCCSGTISPKPAQCCGHVSYNPNTQACCGGKVLSASGISSPACCGNTVYDRNQKICCGNGLHDKSQISQSVYGMHNAVEDRVITRLRRCAAQDRSQVNHPGYRMRAAVAHRVMTQQLRSVVEARYFPTPNSAVDVSVTTLSLNTVVVDEFLQNRADLLTAPTDAVEAHCTIQDSRTAAAEDTQGLEAAAITGIMRGHHPA